MTFRIQTRSRWHRAAARDRAVGSKGRAGLPRSDKQVMLRSPIKNGLRVPHSAAGSQVRAVASVSLRSALGDRPDLFACGGRRSGGLPVFFRRTHHNFRLSDRGSPARPLPGDTARSRAAAAGPSRPAQRCPRGPHRAIRGPLSDALAARTGASAARSAMPSRPAQGHLRPAQRCPRGPHRGIRGPLSDALAARTGASAARSAMPSRPAQGHPRPAQQCPRGPLRGICGPLGDALA